MSDKGISDKMAKNARDFYRPDAAETIAKEIIRLALQHEE